METVILQKKETQMLKKKEHSIDWEIMVQFRRAMDDIVHGRIRKWDPKEAKK
jgi:hypothetical protein